jgi:hypothetical protein
MNDVPDLSTGDHAHTVHARLQDAFAADPVLAMFVPKMVTGLLRAIVHELTVPEPSGKPNTRRVPFGMDADAAAARIVSTIEMSPASVLNRRAREHVSQTITTALFPSRATTPANTSRYLSGTGRTLTA